MKIGFAMEAEQTRSLIRELQECLARGAQSVVLYTTDEAEIIKLMEEAHRSLVPPPVEDIPSPDMFYVGAIWPLAFSKNVVETLAEEYRRSQN